MHFNSFGNQSKRVLQCSILGIILFYVFISDIFIVISEGSADDNQFPISANNIEDIRRLLRITTNKCIDW